MPSRRPVGAPDVRGADAAAALRRGCPRRGRSGRASSPTGTSRAGTRRRRCRRTSRAARARARSSSWLIRVRHVQLLRYGWNGAQHILPTRPTSKGETMAFELPPLPYDYDALEPTIDAKTMEIHHGKHHQAYVTNLNAALEGTEWADRSIDDVITEPRRDPRGQARGRAQQRRRPLEPLAVLADHAAARRRRSVGRARGGDQRHLRRSRPAQGADQRRRREALRLRLDVARRRRRRARRSSRRRTRTTR